MEFSAVTTPAKRRSQVAKALRLVTASGAALMFLPGPAAAAEAVSPVALELNKLETVGQDCRAYLVVNNAADTSYQAFKLDLIMFQTDGVIGKRFTLNIGPLRPTKRVVKLFDISGVSCETVGSFLINDVTECKVDAGEADDCLSRLTVSSLAKAQLTK